MYNVYFDLSPPLALFRANETNHWNKLNRFRIPSGRKQTFWPCARVTGELNQVLSETNPAGDQSGTWTWDLHSWSPAPSPCDHSLPTSKMMLTLQRLRTLCNPPLRMTETMRRLTNVYTADWNPLTAAILNTHYRKRTFQLLAPISKQPRVNHSASLTYSGRNIQKLICR